MSAPTTVGTFWLDVAQAVAHCQTCLDMAEVFTSDEVELVPCPDCATSVDPTPQVFTAGEYDHEIQDRECTGCFDPLGQTRYVYGPNQVDTWHVGCWDEACQSTPETEQAPVQTQRDCFAYDGAVGF